VAVVVITLVIPHEEELMKQGGNRRNKSISETKEK
jgi:hypothetical protein